MLKNNRYAVVLGASGEIGRAICHRLAADGWSLYIHFNEGKAVAKQLKFELMEKFPQLDLICVQADLSKSNGASILYPLLSLITLLFF